MTDVQAPNNTARFFQTINKIGYVIGLPNTWMGDVDFPDRVKRFFKIYRPVMMGLSILFICSELAAFHTQKNLSKKQAGNLFLFGFSHPVLFIWILVTEYYKERIKVLVYQLAVVLKQLHNDEQVEADMMRKVKTSALGFSALFMLSIAFYGFDGMMQVVRGEGTFTTVITFWPDVLEQSAGAEAARFVIFLLWSALMSRVCMVYVNIISTVTCLSHQFKNLHSYFHSLNAIFQDENLTQSQKEEKYEEAFKIGVRMHSQTLWCTKEYQSVYVVCHGLLVTYVVAVLVLLMSQMVTAERSFESVLPFVTTGICMLTSTGFIMWNAGDVTVEAAEMSMAMYFSGWENCHRSARMRRVMVIAMTECQRPVIIWALGIMELSYRSYVSIVKSSYSVFSVII